MFDESCLNVANPEPVNVDRVPPPAPTIDIDVEDNRRGTVKKRFVDFARPTVPTRTKGVCLPAGLSPRRQAISVFVQEEIEQGAFPTVTTLPVVKESPKRVPVITILSPLLAVKGVIERIEGVVELEYKYVSLNTAVAIRTVSDVSRMCTVIGKGVVFVLAGVLTNISVVVAVTTVHMAVSSRTTFLLKFVENPTPEIINK